MEFNATIDLIIKDLDDACRIIDDLKSYPGVPELQIELAKAKCKSAGDVISLLKHIRQQPVTLNPEKIEKPEVKELPVIKTKPAETLLTFDQPSPVEEKKEPVKTSNIQEEIKKSPEKEIVAKKSETPQTGSAIIADKFSNMSARINEQLGTKKGDADVTERIKSKHIHSLKEAVGVNDRFFFIREIFNGDKELYDQAIARLENVQSESDLKAVIASYTGTNVENEAIKQLLDIVKRKLSPDE
ncbi:MAG TPA: hypothetical protein VMV47_13435 [Bacteroidales bacterium]|nr:hypothetical protein [Bacteroidales bacterium]